MASAGLQPGDEGQSEHKLMQDKIETIANILKLAGLDVVETRVENFETSCVGFVFINMYDPPARVWMEIRSLEAGSVVANHPGLTREEIAQVISDETSPRVSTSDDTAKAQALGLSTAEYAEAVRIQAEEGGYLSDIAKRFDKHERSSN